MAAALIVALYLAITVRRLSSCQNNIASVEFGFREYFSLVHMFGITGFFGNVLSFYRVKLTLIHIKNLILEWYSLELPPVLKSCF